MATHADELAAAHDGWNEMQERFGSFHAEVGRAIEEARTTASPDRPRAIETRLVARLQAAHAMACAAAVRVADPHAGCSPTSHCGAEACPGAGRDS